MSRRNLKRSNLRKQQSEKDKLKYIDQTSSQYGNLIGLQHLLGTIQQQDIQYHQYMKIPLELIDLTAAFIASLISGNDYYLLGIPSTVPFNTTATSFGFLDDTFEAYQSNVNFIRKTLSKAQISYSSLIVCLWYIDQFFNNHRHHHHHQKKQRQRHHHHRQQENNNNNNNNNNNTHKPPIYESICCCWELRDIFMASIVVADKYMADITWSNADWAECTNYYYSNQDINQLEQLFLKEMQYQLFITEDHYYSFCHYLEFRLHSRQIAIYNNMMHHHHEMIMSYHTINVLNQHLPLHYQQKLGLTLRPVDAMFLLAKITTQFCFMYVTTLVATLSTFYLCYQYYHTIISFLLYDVHPHVLCMLIHQLDPSLPLSLQPSQLLKYDVPSNNNSNNNNSNKMDILN